MTGNRSDDRAAAHWFDSPNNIRNILRALIAGCVLLLLGEFVVQRHLYTDVESLFGFYALSGFAAGAILVLLAWGLRKLVMRSEDYYDSVDD